MAKVLGLTNTTIRGKIGNTVFYTRKAQNLARMYQPVVANPKSDLQLRQRDRLKQSVDINREIREGLKNIYGTAIGGYEYQGIQKIIMNSGIVKQYQSPTNGVTGSTRALFLSGLNIHNILKGVGDSYEADRLNMFEPGVTLGCNNINANGNCQLLTPLVFSNSNGSNYNWRPLIKTAEAQADYYFGCDYELGNKLFLIGIIPAGTQILGQGQGTVDRWEIDVDTVDIDGITFNGTRIRGCSSVAHSSEAGSNDRKVAIANCGSDWKYYYKITTSTENHYIGTGLTVQGNIQGLTQTAVLYNLCYVIATANSNTRLGIQVLKGVSYFSYTAHDEFTD